MLVGTNESLLDLVVNDWYYMEINENWGHINKPSYGGLILMRKINAGLYFCV